MHSLPSVQLNDIQDFNVPNELILVPWQGHLITSGIGNHEDSYRHQTINKQWNRNSIRIHKKSDAMKIRDFGVPVIF